MRRLAGIGIGCSPDLFEAVVPLSALAAELRGG
jgi:hypothetical protein